MESGPEMFRVPSDAYERLVGRYGAALGAGLTAFAGVAPGARALDAGCGPGALTAVLAGLLGPARVAAADPSPPFVAACRARVPGVEVVVAPAERLPFPGGTFDVALAQLAVNFFADPEAGVRELARVTRPGGTVAACVWDYAGEMTVLRAFWDAARVVDPVGAAAADEGVVMPWCGEGELAELWRAAGLRDVRARALVVEARYEDFADLWSPFPAGVGPSGAYCAGLGTAQQASLRDELRSVLAVPDGPFTLTARAWAAAGIVG